MPHDSVMTRRQRLRAHRQASDQNERVIHYGVVVVLGSHFALALSRHVN